MGRQEMRRIQKCGLMVFLRDCSTAARLVQQELEIVVALMAGVLDDPVRKPPDIDLGRPWTRSGVCVLDPPDLVKALKSSPALWKHWQELSYSHHREHVDFVEQAKKLATRTRRIEQLIEMISARPHESTTRRAASRRATPR